ncbi:glutamate--cysteine ligase [Luteimicrobium subarcticum]|uniref:Putative glutamate--cysteine ligase 2 n=1 Tax=Luteimicrobium subarcticum TaxID=620910 RepID=A0A2M8W436_9MICO|nr:glutamate--cysteine ligase [Luteimicrobium subarcticum]PJI85687.1 carboxylate-amine ligase [Luteimicrobium subarcticum]
MRTVGVEEEYLLVDHDGRPAKAARDTVAAAHDAPGDGELEPELKQQQVETATAPHDALAEIEQDLRAGRALAATAARAAGARALPLGTSPVAGPTHVSPGRRYRAMTDLFARTAQEQLTCGCHVHVHVAGDEEGVAVIDRVRAWLPLLLALTANSPFWGGADTHYASYRSQVWKRWPTAGPTPLFGSASAYHGTVDDLLSSGVALDRGMIYFDARLAVAYPTVEIRVADVPLDVRDTVLLAALARGLVETAARAWSAGDPADDVRVELLRAATWRAARSGLRDELLDPRTHRPVPAAEALRTLVRHVHEALADHGDLDLVRAGVDRVLADGTGADAQRRWRGDGTSALLRRAAAAMG